MHGNTVSFKFLFCLIRKEPLKRRHESKWMLECVVSDVIWHREGLSNMFIAYFLLFVVFNGKLTVETAAFGAVFAALLYAFSCRFLGYSFKKDIRMVRGAGAGICYLGMLTIEIIKANLQVIRMILTPGFEPDPQLIQFRSGLRDEGHRVALADSITLTPGTITCDLEGDIFTVHCLDEEQREGLENSCFLTKLRKMEMKTQAHEQEEG